MFIFLEKSEFWRNFGYDADIIYMFDGSFFGNFRFRNWML